MQGLVLIFGTRYGTSTHFGQEPLSEGLAKLQINSKHHCINVAPLLSIRIRAFTLGFSLFTRRYLGNRFCFLFLR